MIEDVAIGDRVRHISERARDGGRGPGTVTLVDSNGVAIRFDRRGPHNETYYPLEWFTSKSKHVRIEKLKL